MVDITNLVKESLCALDNCDSISHIQGRLSEWKRKNITLVIKKRSQNNLNVCDLVKEISFPLSQNQKLITALGHTFFIYLVSSEVMSNSNIRLL